MAELFVEPVSLSVEPNSTLSVDLQISKVDIIDTINYYNSSTWSPLEFYL